MRAPPEGARWISEAQEARLREVPHFRDNDEARGDLNALFGFYMVNFVDQIFKFEPQANIRSIADVGTGYGWLAIAFARRTAGIRIVALEPNEPRLAAARRIAEILGVSDKIEWRAGTLGTLPLADQEIDVAYCIEVIEHIGGKTEFVRDLARVTKNLLTLTTPNKAFPVIRHDTWLPFCHWLPPGTARDFYAAVFGGSERQYNNRFWSPQKLLSTLYDFEKESGFFQFRRYEDYLDAQRQLYPEGYQKRKTSKSLERMYYRAVWRTGKKSIYVLPNLASTFRRRASSRLRDAA